MKKVNETIIIFICIMTCGLITSCSSDDDSSSESNNNNAFVGTWRAISKEGSINLDYDFIEFNRDATCMMESYPYFKNGYDFYWSYGNESKILTLHNESNSRIISFSAEFLSNGDLLLSSTDDTRYSAVYRKYVESELPIDIRIIGPWYLVSKKGNGCFGNEKDYTYVEFNKWGYPTIWEDLNWGEGWVENRLGLFSWSDGSAIRLLYFKFNKDGSWTATVEGSEDESTYSREFKN